MTITRSTAETVTQLLARVRREAGDRAADASGTTIDPAGRRFSDADDVIPAINDALITLGTFMSLKFSGEALTYTDLAYTEGTDNWGMALPTAIGAEGVAMVTDMTDPNYPVEIFPVHASEMANIQATNTQMFQIARKYYALVAPTVATEGYRIVVHPNGTGRTFRIFWVAAPFITTATGASSDTPLLSTRWRELIGLLAAINLLSVDNEVPDNLTQRYGQQLELFRAFCQRQKHPARVKLNRRLY